MLKRTTVFLYVLAIAVTAGAQEAPATAKPPEPQPPRAVAQAANVRVELTITDQRSDSQTPPKTVTLLVEDRQNGRLRTGRGNAALPLRPDDGERRVERHERRCGIGGVDDEARSAAEDRVELVFACR